MKLVPSKDEIRQFTLDLGASAVGFCKVDNLIEKFHPEIRQQASQLPNAISIGIALQKAVMDTLVDRPNDIYKSHYRTANSQLDRIAFSLSQKIYNSKKRAMPIPASMIVTRYPLLAHLNHREIAWKAGLGWRGKNNLLVSPEFGGRFRLATILTDLDLEPDEIIEKDCGKCKACIKRCPADAIGDAPEEFDLDKCQKQVVYFSKQSNFGQLICGLCLNCCPHAETRKKEDGRKYNN